MGHVQRFEAPKIAKLVQITPITMVYGTYNELVTGANLNQLITGGHHFVGYLSGWWLTYPHL